MFVTLQSVNVFSGLIADKNSESSVNMDFSKKYDFSDENRREELIKKIEAAVNNLTLEELESLHYDMITKNYIND